MLTKRQTYGGHQIFSTLISSYPIDVSTSYRQLLFWLEELAAAGQQNATYELALFEEYLGNQDNHLKWFTLCAMLCDRSLRSEANIKLKYYSQTLNSNELQFARKLAGDWFNSRYKPVNLGSSSGGMTTALGKEALKFKGIEELKYKGRFVALLIGVNDYAHEAWHDLESPLNDISFISDVLAENYECGGDPVKKSNS